MSLDPSRDKAELEKVLKLGKEAMAFLESPRGIELRASYPELEGAYKKIRTGWDKMRGALGVIGNMRVKGLPLPVEPPDKYARVVREMALPVRRAELEGGHIAGLSQRKTQGLLMRVIEAQGEVESLRSAVRKSQEARVLRGLLAMAEADLRERLKQHAKRS
jgi:hypothetical protein